MSTNPTLDPFQGQGPTQFTPQLPPSMYSRFNQPPMQDTLPQDALGASWSGSGQRGILNGGGSFGRNPFQREQGRYVGNSGGNFGGMQSSPNIQGLLQLLLGGGNGLGSLLGSQRGNSAFGRAGGRGMQSPFFGGGNQSSAQFLPIGQSLGQSFGNVFRNPSIARNLRGGNNLTY